MTEYSPTLRSEVAKFAQSHGDWTAQRVYEIPDATIRYWREQRFGHRDDRPCTKLREFLKTGSKTRAEIAKHLRKRDDKNLRRMLSYHTCRGTILRLTDRVPTYSLTL